MKRTQEQSAKRRMIEEQIKELHAKIIGSPGPNDPMNMVGFGATILAAKMQTWLLLSDFEEQKEASKTV